VPIPVYIVDDAVSVGRSNFVSVLFIEQSVHEQFGSIYVVNRNASTFGKLFRFSVI